MTHTAAPAPDADMPVELFLDQLLGDELFADAHTMPGAFVGQWFVRAYSVDATLEAIHHAAQRLRRKIPGIVEHVRVQAYTRRDGENPLWCETHRRFGCDEQRYGATCYQAPCPAAEIAVTVEGLPVYDGDVHVAGILTRDREGVVSVHGIGPNSASMAAHRSLMGQCVHCGTKRVRSTTVLLRSAATGEILPVGKSCLADYTGGSMRPEILATLTGLGDRFNIAVGGVFDDLGDSAPVLDIVAVAMLLVERHGFVPTTDPLQTPTRERAFCSLLPRKGIPQEIVPAEITDEQRTRAARLIAAIADDAEDTDADRGSDYLLNLRATIEQEWAVVSGKRNKLGLLVSLPTAAQRRIERIERDAAREQEQAGKVNAHLGAERERMELTGVIAIARVIDTDWGAKDMLVVDTPAGQVKAFGTIGGFDQVEAGETVTLVGTVKGHGEYQGMRQTNLNRVKIIRKV